MRVVRFYQELFSSSASCPPRPPPPLPPPPRPPPSPPPLPPPPVSPRPCLHQLPPQLLPCQLFAKLFANFPAQCAPLDLNLGPSPSSVCTAGPQWLDRIPEDMPDRVLEDMSDRMPEDMPDKMP